MASLTRFFHPVLAASALRRDRPAGVRIVARGSLLRMLMPVVRWAALFIGRREVAADAAIVRHVRPLESLDGLRLTRFDKPLIHNRKLLDSIYFGLPRPRPAAVADLP